MEILDAIHCSEIWHIWESYAVLGTADADAENYTVITDFRFR